MRKVISFAILFISVFFLSYSKKQTNILILGNSITQHIPDKSIGWKGNWGIAASSADNDFESKLTHKLQKKYPQKDFKVTPKNIAFWENNFNYNLDQFSELSNQKYDILIIRLGENVNEASPDFPNYEKELNVLINRYKNKNTKVIITGNVWSSIKKDSIQEKVAKDNEYHYISLVNFQGNSQNYATGKFENEQVAAHPSDVGMENIAELLFRKVEEFLDKE